MSHKKSIYEGFYQYNQRIKKLEELEEKHLNTEPRLSELDKYKKELEKEKTELIKLITEYEQYIPQTERREKDLQQHIQHISSILNLTDIDEIKQAINELYTQIMEGVDRLEHLKKNEIQKKKKDLEDRLSMRLLDNKIRYEEVLIAKAQEKEDLVKHFDKLSSELEKIKENYANINLKKSKVKSDNNDLKVEVSNYESLNHQLKTKLLGLQSQMMKVHEILNAKKEKTFKKPSTNRGSLRLDKSLSNLIQSNRSINIKYATNLITEEEFVKKNYRSSSVISSLCNILDNNNLKLKRLGRFDKKDENNELKERIYHIIKQNKYHSFLNLNNPQMARTTYATPQLYIELNRQQRDILVECLVNDKYINSIFEQGQYHAI
jgi:chromosome segregation ATPase